ncbi:MAG TPA: cob(I)yrinic acid a,c-diamide adenosyltransferase [Anaerolineae bacterium]|nr:cob(I)yrinic acid a,c-diamide adenosyltransferase [Anaerolineae bacterium]
MSDSQFYTRRGDDGYTGLLGPERVPKYDPRPEAYGTVDEVQAVLGLVRATDCASRTGEILLAIQRDLYKLMAELASAGDNAAGPFAGSVTAAYVDQLENWIAEFEAEIEMPREFVIPGDSQPGAALHLARTVTRRAERLAVRLAHEGILGNELVVRYLNRLSSLLFVLAVFEDGAAIGTGVTLARE